MSAARHASRNALPTLSLVIGLPLFVEMNAKSPTGPASRVLCRTSSTGDHAPSSGLLSVNPDHASLDALLAEPSSVATTKAGVAIDMEHDALSRAAGPSFELDDLVFIPNWKSLRLRLRHGLAGGRIHGDVLSSNRPFIEPAHGVDEVSGRRTRRVANCPASIPVSRGKISQSQHSAFSCFLPRTCRRDLLGEACCWKHFRGRLHIDLAALRAAPIFRLTYFQFPESPFFGIRQTLAFSRIHHSLAAIEIQVTLEL